MGICEIKEYLSTSSCVIAILTFLFVIINNIANYKYGEKCEAKFKIPHNLFRFNIEEVLIETFEYLLMLASIMFLIIFNEFCKKLCIRFNNISYGMLFIILYLYMIATVGIVHEKLNWPFYNEQQTLCCELIKFFIRYLLIPAILTCLCIINIISIECIIKILKIVAAVCIIIFFGSYFNFDKKRYPIIVKNDKSLAVLLGYNEFGFILMNVEKKENNIFKIKKLGCYEIKKEISLVNRKYGIIVIN